MRATIVVCVPKRDVRRVAVRRNGFCAGNV